jgi:hypothetical protein
MVATLAVAMATIKAMVVETMVTATMTVTIMDTEATITEVGMVDHPIVMVGAASVSMVDMILVNMTQVEDFNTGTVIDRPSSRWSVYKHHLLGILSPIHT